MYIRKMTVADFVNHSETQRIAKKHLAVKADKIKAAYNLFTISSYNCYLENFHSDIIASILDTSAPHREGNKFLHLFISYLNTNFNTSLKTSDFEHTLVSRETGRIDLWIRDELSKTAIIIENKINDAVDMEDQLDRYFVYSQQARGYQVVAIIYLSLDGLKFAPKTTADIDHLIHNVGAFTAKPNDIVNGWLSACLKHATQDDSRSFIHQYINLLKHLGNKNMDNDTMSDFYGLLSEKDNLRTIESILEMNGRLPSYRADKFAASVGENYAPFKKQIRYRPHYYLFDNYLVGNSYLKLDVWFEQDGNAALRFWIPAKQTAEGRFELKQVLLKIAWEELFDEDIDLTSTSYSKRFDIGNEYPVIADVDSAIAKFVRDLMDALQTDQTLNDN
jgi:hypothetical protein